MTRRERLGLTLLAGGIGLALVNVVTWMLGRGIGGWRPVLSGVLMVGGLAFLAGEAIRGSRQPGE